MWHTHTLQTKRMGTHRARPPHASSLVCQQHGAAPLALSPHAAHPITYQLLSRSHSRSVGSPRVCCVVVAVRFRVASPCCPRSQTKGRFVSSPKRAHRPAARESATTITKGMATHFFGLPHSFSQTCQQHVWRANTTNQMHWHPLCAACTSLRVLTTLYTCCALDHRIHLL